MKIISRLFAFLLFIFICFFVVINISNNITLETNFLSLQINVGCLILFCVIAGSLGTLLLSSSFNNSNKLKRQIDNEKLNCELESEKVKQLQAKINTLEAALKIATKK